MKASRPRTKKREKSKGRDTIRTILGAVEVARTEHLRCANCVRYRLSNQHPDHGYCTRPLYDRRGGFLGRANDLVAADHYCDQFVSRLGDQQ